MTHLNATSADLVTYAAGSATPATAPGNRPDTEPDNHTGLPSPAAGRDVSIWEITTWILPMASEHLRRVLAQTPGLTQGRAGTEGGTRWFTLQEVATLRRHFAAVAARRPGGRSKSYVPHRPTGARAPLITFCAPLGRAGRSTSLLHLACAAALGGTRVLVLDADPAGRLARDLGAAPDSPGTGLLPLIARSCGAHLYQVNAGRMDRGEAPLPLDEAVAAALEADTTALIRPTAWPGLDIIAASPALLLADQQLAAWRGLSRSWQPARALAMALDREGLRDRYDLILCDTGRGLGPLVLGLLTSSDMLLLPSRDGTNLAPNPAPGLRHLAQAVQREEAEARATARALGQMAPAFGWRRIAALPTALPHVPQVASGQAAHFYALDYRAVGRLTYAPLRDGCDAAWRGLAAMLAGLWAEDADAARTVSESVLPR